jgi:predicted NAD/FAD-dependent oxidoreductase
MPQNLAMLDVGGCALDPDLRARLDAVAYRPTLALLVTLDGPAALGPPGGVQLDDGPFSFIADNQLKGISDAPAVTFHASHELSAARWEDDADEILADLVDLARPWLGTATILEAQLKTWRYAQPVLPAEHEIEATAVEGAPLVFAGDAFAGAKVEGAFVSGHAAGTHLASILAPT